MDDQPDRMRGYRLIAPRHVDVEKPSSPQTLTGDEGKTKRASMACLECKRRRTKCSAEKPCTECSTHGRECVYNESADKRRKAYSETTVRQLENAVEQLKIAKNDLHYYHAFLEDLLASIRYSNRYQLDQLVQVIQDTVRNPDPDNKSGYSKIREAIALILSEFEDAEGSDEPQDVDQSMAE